MDQAKVTLTPQKYKELERELEELKGIGRKVLADKLDQYRDDIEEDDANAYSEVQQDKEAMEIRIAELEQLLETAIVTDKCDNNGTVGVGCEVMVQLGRKKNKYCVVSSVESNPEENMISADSPLGQALLGKKVGDEIVVKTPQGEEKGKILNVK